MLWKITSHQKKRVRNAKISILTEKPFLVGAPNVPRVVSPERTDWTKWKLWPTSILGECVLLFITI